MSRRTMRRLRSMLLAALLVPSAGRADHPFILPSSTLYSGEGNVATFDAAGADHVFFFDHRPLQLESIRIAKPDGTPGSAYDQLRGRLRSVFDLRLDQQGTWKVASQQTMVIGSFRLNGEERRVGGRGGPPPVAPGGPAGEGGGRGDGERAAMRRPGVSGGGSAAPGAPAGPGAGDPGQPRRQPSVALQDIPADATDVHLTEIVTTAETFVTAGEPTTTVFRLAGKGLEFDPITHPNAIAAGETARFRFLIDGQPAPGLKVTVVAGGDRYREDVGTMNLTTGVDGVVAIRWPRAGMYWVGAEATDKHPVEPRAEARRMTYAATLEVMTP